MRYAGSMGQTLAHLLVHIIFSTHRREPHISTQIETRLHAYIGGICRNVGVDAVTIGGFDDHVHMLVLLRTDTNVASLVRDIKANSPRWMHEQGIRDFRWQGGYAAFSVSESVSPRVIDYINGQRDHHRRVSFMDELRQICRRHNVAIDEEHAWD